MEEAAELSKHIAIMDKGKIIASGTHDELIRLVGQETRIELTLNMPAEKLLADWRTISGVTRIDSPDTQTGKISALVQDSNRVLPHLFESAAKAGARITSVDIQEPNLESVFLHLTGRALRD
jgi:ABC-2 type transport system ATP-binding protein